MNASAFLLRRILVAIDFSTPSRAAMACAKSLLAKFGAELHLVHVFDFPVPLSSTAALPLILPEVEIERDVRSRLKDAAVKEVLSVRRQNIHVLKGRPYVEICRLARELAVDLIIMGTRGRTGLKHLALGSTAERVVRHAPCPVLVLHSLGSSRRPPATLKSVLVPTDFSACATAGLESAKAIAKEFGSKLALLHSIDLHYYSTNPEYTLYDYPALYEAAEKAAREQMDETRARLEADGFQVESTIESGHAGAQICQRAGELGANLIVISTHGRTGLKHNLLGSTAEYIVRHAPCAVMVVPSRARTKPVARP